MIDNIILNVCLTLLVGVIILMVKNDVTHAMHHKILDAIYYYKMWYIDHDDIIASHKVEFYDIEPYDVTLFRIWDWGYKRILPPEKFELIKPFIK